MDTILVTGGEIPPFIAVRDFFTDKYVCVADSGYDWILENNLGFDKLVGDMDSLKSKKELLEIEKNKIDRYSMDKYDTDTIIGLKHLKKIGANNITLIGGGGGRLDHLLGIISLFTTDLSPNIWVTSRELIYKVRGKIFLNREYKKNISVYPLNKVDCSINSYGLKWNLNRIDWTYKSIGISNFVNRTDAWIDSGNTEILVVVPLIGMSFE